MSRHVKNAHPLASLISHASQVVSFLQVSFLPVVLPGFIPLTSWGWFWAQSNSILKLFESRFACPRLFHKIPQAIQDKVRQAFRLRLDQIVRNLTNNLTWFIFLLLFGWCLCYIRGGCSSHQKVFAHLKRWLVFSLKEFSHASCAPCFHHWWQDFSTTCFRQCLTLGRVGEYNRAVKALQPMTPSIPSKDTIVALHQLHPPSFRPYSSSYFLLSTWAHICHGYESICPNLSQCSSFVFRWVIWDGIWTFLRLPHTKGPILVILLKLFQVDTIVAREDIFRSVALVLKVSRLLAMANDTGGLCLIFVNEVFLQFINHSIVL